MTSMQIAFVRDEKEARIGVISNEDLENYFLGEYKNIHKIRLAMLNDVDPKARITTYQAARKTNAGLLKTEDH